MPAADFQTPMSPPFGAWDKTIRVQHLLLNPPGFTITPNSGLRERCQARQ